MALVITVVTILAVLPVLYADDTASSQLTFNHGSSAGVLNNCDDCYTGQTDIRYYDIYMDGQRFGAFAVGSNGNVLILSTTSTPIRGYPFYPQPISQARGSPMIAPLWQDNDLRCNPGNRVFFEETCDSGLLAFVRNHVGIGFNPRSAVVVTYQTVQQFSCRSNTAQNTYQLIIATDPSSCKTYVIFDYDDIAWSRGSPTVGFTDGQGNGFQFPITNNDARSLSNTLLVYRIDETFPAAQVEEAKINRGNFVYMQQDKDDTHVEQKDGDGQAYKAQAYKAQNNQGSVYLQDFGDKKDALKELNIALQQYPQTKNEALQHEAHRQYGPYKVVHQ